MDIRSKAQEANELLTDEKDCNTFEGGEVQKGDVIVVDGIRDSVRRSISKKYVFLVKKADTDLVMTCLSPRDSQCFGKDVTLVSGLQIGTPFRVDIPQVIDHTNLIDRIQSCKVEKATILQKLSGFAPIVLIMRSLQALKGRRRRMKKSQERAS